MIRRASWMLPLVLIAMLFGRPGPARADYESGVAPVYLIVSLSETFDTESTPGEEQDPSTVGSPTILLNIGSMVAGGGILNTRFVRAAISTLPLPEGTSPGQLAGYDSTILGSFETTDFSEVHMVTPQSGFVPPDIQVAVHEATRAGALDALANSDGVPQFPTTYAIADAISGYLPEGSEETVSGILAAVFGATEQLTAGDGEVVAVQSEGELFPHTTGSPALFNYSLEVSSSADLTTDVCLIVPIDVKPDSDTNPINRKAKGRLPVAILSTETFDATDYECADIRIAGVEAVHVAVEDVDGDGLDDLITHFKIPCLKDAGAIEMGETTLTLEATLADGSCVEGTDSITVLEQDDCDDDGDDEDDGHNGSCKDDDDDDGDGDKDKCDDKDGKGKGKDKCDDKDGKGKDKDDDKDGKGKGKDKDDDKDGKGKKK